MLGFRARIYVVAIKQKKNQNQKRLNCSFAFYWFWVLIDIIGLTDIITLLNGLKEAKLYPFIGHRNDNTIESEAMWMQVQYV